MRVAVAFTLAVISFAAENTEKVVLPTSADAIAQGKRLYMGGCTYCHGPTGDGGKGANLAVPELSRAPQDEDLVAIIQTGVPGTEMPGAHHMTPNEVLMTAAFVRTLGKVAGGPVPGDWAAGKALYAKQGCANCHTTVENGALTGGLGGPDLSAIGLRRSPAHLRESVANPEAVVDAAYVITEVRLKDGRRVAGRTLYEDTFSISVRDGSGRNQTLLKSTVAEITRNPNKSPMPGYSTLTAAELDNLTAYLASLKERP
ncbi:MAG: c-type cytochrome [Bryobacteraceae bacterium]